MRGNWHFPLTRDIHCGASRGYFMSGYIFFIIIKIFNIKSTSQFMFTAFFLSWLYSDLLWNKYNTCSIKNAHSGRTWQWPASTFLPCSHYDGETSLTNHLFLHLKIEQIPSKMEVAPRYKLLSDTVHAVDTVDNARG